MTLQFVNHPIYQNSEIKTLYNKNRERTFGINLPIHIFGTGSEGNSIYLKPQKTLIDVGLPFLRYTEYDPYFFLDVNYIIVTHHHGDHLNPGTLLRILEYYPHIKVIMLPFMFEYITSEKYKPKFKKRLDANGKTVYQIGSDFREIKNKPVYELDGNGKPIIEELPYQHKFQKHASGIIYATHELELTTHEDRTFRVNPLTTKHGDIVNLAIEIFDEDLDFKFLYASDLDDLNGQRAFVDYAGRQQHITGLRQDTEYNIIFLEANYDENIVNEYLDSLNPNDPDYAGKNARVQGNMRHISEQESFSYIDKVLSNNGYFIPLHASSTFGTLFQ